jgi:type IV pilus assembly protein PilC
MARFSYIAIDQQGHKQRGITEAESSFALATRLKQNGLTIISATRQDVRSEPVSKPKSKSKLFMQKIKTEELVIFFRQLATMVEAGVQLVDSLTVLVDQIQNQRFHEVLTHVRNQLQGGTSFSAALAEYPDVFPVLAISMVKVAEVSGSLGNILDQLAAYIEQKDKIEKKIKSATSYPRFILIFFGIVVLAVVFGLVPVFKNIFESFGAQLPGPTLVILNTSNFLKHNLIIEVILLIAIIAGFKFMQRNPKGRHLLHNLYFKIPVFGSLLLKSVVARFSQTLGTLVRNGVSLVDALQIAGETTNNVIIQESLEKVRKMVMGGSALARALAEFPLFPTMMVKMIAVGEESGALEAMLAKVSEFNERQLNSTIDNLTAIIEPVLMIGLGILALIVVIALYLPIFQMSGAISG